MYSQPMTFRAYKLDMQRACKIEYIRSSRIYHEIHERPGYHGPTTQDCANIARASEPFVTEITVPRVQHASSAII